MSKNKIASLEQYCFDGSGHFDIAKTSTSETSLCSEREKAEKRVLKNNDKIDELQNRLYADKKEGVIFLFQAMDAAGKDGTIRAVLSCLSPHGVHEAAFKSPSAEDLAHDYLWRITRQIPAKGEIAIFNRSHYEEVLIGRVKELYRTQDCARRINLDEVIGHRYEDIKAFEKYLYHNSVRVVKIFLHLSKEEQARRFLSRIEEPEKNWKFSASDYEERKYWDAYQAAFESAINHTATAYAPWYIVPADNKWYMRYVVSEIILKTLEDMDPQYPSVTKARLETFKAYQVELQREIEPRKEKSKEAEKEKGKSKDKAKSKKK
ncbi:MAG: polyphosphate kinase 2 family protein [Succinivibrio sp.]|nr:polyphosphate kinase 2 family protein [Succinivibrio sp.]